MGTPHLLLQYKNSIILALEIIAYINEKGRLYLYRNSGRVEAWIRDRKVLFLSF